MSDRFLNGLPYVYHLRLRRFINNSYIGSVPEECLRFYKWTLNCPFIVFPMYTTSLEGFHFFPCRGETCQLWNHTTNECGYVVQKQEKIHMHRQHWHLLEHGCSEGYVDEPCGGDEGVVVSVGGQPKAAFLLAEFMGNEDLDNDNKVYGKDFKIDPNDPDCPVMLKEIANHPQLTATVTISWQDYLDSV